MEKYERHCRSSVQPPHAIYEFHSQECNLARSPLLYVDTEVHSNQSKNDVHDVQDDDLDSIQVLVVPVQGLPGGNLVFPVAYQGSRDYPIPQRTGLHSGLDWVECTSVSTYRRRLLARLHP